MSKFLFLVSQILLFNSCILAQEKNVFEDLQEYIAFRSKNNRYSGVTAIYRNDSLVFSAVSGFANRSWNSENNFETKFDLASVTKMFTAAGIAVLLERNQLQLMDSFMKYWPGFPLPEANNITIKQLLSHTSGLSDLFFEESYLLYDRNRLRKLADYNRFLKTIRVGDVPEDNIAYSNTNFLILGAIIEKVTGQDYYEFIEKEIFRPLAMNNTGFYEKDRVVFNKAEGYFRDAQAAMEFGVPNDGILRSNSVIRPVKGSPAGGAFSTVGDMQKFMDGIQAGKVISEETFNSMIKEVQGGYGNGFQHYTQHEVQLWGHSGGFYGVSTMVFYLPQHNLTFISLTNQDFAAQPVMDRLINLLVDRTVYQPVAVPGWELEKFEGYYEVDSGEMKGRQLFIEAKEDYLLFDAALEFYPVGKNQFVDIDNDGFIMTFKFSASGDVIGFERGDNWRYYQDARKIDPGEVEQLRSLDLPDHKLQEYAVEFRFAESGMMPGHQPDLTVQDGALIVDNMMRFLPYEKDKFFLEDDPGMRLYFTRNETGEIEIIKVIRDNVVVGTLLPLH